MPLAKTAYYVTSAFTLLKGVQPLGRLLALFLGQRPDQPVPVTLQPANLTFQVRSAMDVWALKETLLDHFYERTGFALQDGWTVIDIGGGVGDFTIAAARGFPHSKVYAFEPTPSSFSLLTQNLKTNGITNAYAYPAAAWSSDGEIEIDTAPGEPVQFVSQAHEALMPRTPGKVVVPSYALATLFERIGETRCHLMKLDCEGAEYEILMAAPRESLLRIERMVMEYHDVPGHHHSDLARYLEDAGYRVRITPNVVHDNIGYLSAIQNVLAEKAKA